MPHPRTPWSGVAFVGVYWNCEERVEKLLTYVRPYFKYLCVAVQKSDDNTLEVCKRLADIVIEEPWHGRGDPSFQRVLDKIGTPWSFVVSDDEWPSPDLLDSFQDLADRLHVEEKDGAWFHFTSTIDGFDFTREGDSHLRFFRSNLKWPSTPHARVMTDNTIHWPVGSIAHDRSLDEMMEDYVRRFDLTAENPRWDTIQAHNVRMIEGACRAVAERKGWEYVQSFGWWPRVRDIAFEGKDQFTAAAPEAPEPAPAAVVVKPVVRRTAKPVAKRPIRRKAK